MGRGKNYYQILGLPPFSGPDRVKATYRQLARKYHPDLHPGDRHNEDRFKEINEAYDVLGSPEQKAAYDATLLQASYRPVYEAGKYADTPAWQAIGLEIWAVIRFLLGIRLLQRALWLTPLLMLHHQACSPSGSHDSQGPSGFLALLILGGLGVSVAWWIYKHRR